MNLWNRTFLRFTLIEWVIALLILIILARFIWAGEAARFEDRLFESVGLAGGAKYLITVPLAVWIFIRLFRREQIKARRAGLKVVRAQFLVVSLGPLALVIAVLVSSASGQQAEAVSDALIVQALAPELDGVLLGRMETLDEERKRNLGPEPEEHIRFRYEMDLNSDGQQELILLGNYAEADSRRSFVLIAVQAAAGQWVRSQLFTFDRDFVIGLGFDNRLAVNFCTGCDAGGWIEWTGSAYEFRLYPPQGVPGIE